MDFISSRYNWCIQEQDTLVLYNGFTGALVEIDQPELFGVARSLADDNSVCGELSSLQSTIFNSMKEMGFIIPRDFSEREFLASHTDQMKYQKNLSITVVVTTDCNFNCSYCYQDDKEHAPEVITDEVIEDIGKLVQQLSSQKLLLTLYGGEPLLYKDKCIELLTTLGKIENLEINANLITNGFNFDTDTAVSLSRLGVQRAQITIDGRSETHNKYRSHRSGNPTHSVVLRNTKAASQFMKILVRVSLGEDVVSDFDYVKREFRNFPDVSVYPALVKDYSDLSACSKADFDKLEGYLGNDLMPNLRLKARHPGCIATKINGFVVMPDGQLRKCWREVSENSYLDRTPYGIDARSLPGIHEQWRSFNPYRSGSKCFECKMLPTCGGGCPFDHVYGRSITCKFSEKGYEEYIRRIYNSEYGIK